MHADGKPPFDKQTSAGIVVFISLNVVYRRVNLSTFARGLSLQDASAISVEKDRAREQMLNPRVKPLAGFPQ